MTIRTHILGFPRIGAARELKLALESHWRGEVSEAALVFDKKSLLPCGIARARPLMLIFLQ